MTRSHPSASGVFPPAAQVQLVPWSEVNLEDALALLLANRDHLLTWEPSRPDAYFTKSAQADLRVREAEATREGRERIFAILAGARLAGRVALTGIERGPFQSCHLGYWVGQEFLNRGLATAAVSKVVGLAFQELGLHRVEAAVMPANAISIRVLGKCGFAKVGFAKSYLQIQGRWEDHLIFARTNL